ncbi:uncharacterized protein LOC127253030 [Andrographis paniculata]|uniref:uncharacterized protein LOC127253030 n=1 Tax=Andrographis paniculata TaxID=175694 RepID=UPI0021E8FFE7|nr:uncharacterized protein LOC127253030 [Andrographis paniculata]
MDCVANLKDLILDYYYYDFFGCGFFRFGCFNQVLGLFLLFAFGLNILCSGRFSRCLIRCLWCLGGKSGGGLKSSRLCSNVALDLDRENVESLEKSSLLDKVGEAIEELNPSEASGEELDIGNGDWESGHTTDKKLPSDSELSTLKRLIQIERQRANAVREDLAKERSSSAIAAKEAMAMILRLQSEKSSIELESRQYKRLAEEKQIHDQQVIRLLQLQVWRNESKTRSLEDQLKLCRQKLMCADQSTANAKVEEAPSSSFNGGIREAPENVLYSSREAALSPE